MGGFFGAVTDKDCVYDVFFGTDYHSHLGTRRGGMAAYSKETGLQRAIHNIENAPFRTKFQDDVEKMHGTAAIGCISDSDPQPIIALSKFSTYAITTVGIINNADDLVKEIINNGAGYLPAMSGGKINSTELVAALINTKDNFVDGIKYAQSVIEGSMSILILTDEGYIIAARDKVGRTPIFIGKGLDGHSLSFETFASEKLGYTITKEIGPGEIVKVTKDNFEVLAKAGKKKKICAFLWTYYGYPTSRYEGVNVEVMRNKNGETMAQRDIRNDNTKGIDYVCGVPDSGTAHAIGYSNKSGIPYARPFIKYTPTWPRSFMPANQSRRNIVAKMKLVPVHDLIEGKNLLFVDDSIVRGTQMRETVEFLYNNGAKNVHIRSACPPIMYGCKYLNFSRSTSEMELIARRVVLELEGADGFNHLEEYSDSDTERGKALRNKICENLHFTSLEYQSLEGLIKSIGIDREDICTYCWDGKE
jgi:amidophosphoribosyltransferase